MLESGSFFEGESFGASGECFGELVFATGMTGYQETITDPSYAGQIVVQTAPQIGITGMNTEDEESDRIWVAGYVVREYSKRVSNHRSERSLASDLESQGIVAITGVDTRDITLEIRSKGAMRAGIFTGEQIPDTVEMLRRVRAIAGMAGQSLSSRVTTAEQYVVPAVGVRLARVVVLDLGVKGSTLKHLSERGIELVVAPASSDFSELESLNPAGYFFSNGPGDPQASDGQIRLLRAILSSGKPFFGICFGNQLLGRALGFETYKLPFGHRGINQPVMDSSTGRVEVTAHNHGFAVALEHDEASSPEGFGRVRVTHRSLNDGVVEGLECLDIPAFAVQYHPDAAAGPHDSHYLFDRFVNEIVRRQSA